MLNQRFYAEVTTPDGTTHKTPVKWFDPSRVPAFAYAVRSGSTERWFINRWTRKIDEALDDAKKDGYAVDDVAILRTKTVKSE